MKTVVWFLVLSFTSTGVVVIPKQYEREADCRKAAQQATASLAQCVPHYTRQ